MSIGTKLLPERPIFLRSLSIINATLAMYPLSSNIERKKNSTTITGRKLNTLPTPAKIPSIIREWTTGFNPYALRALSVNEETAPIPVSIKSANKEPNGPNVI